MNRDIILCLFKGLASQGKNRQIHTRKRLSQNECETTLSLDTL